MSKEDIDYSLYLVTDQIAAGGRPLPRIIDESIRGGVTVVQFRQKSGSDGSVREEALAIKEVTEERGVPLIVNDRVDLAFEIGAAGVHVGQSDIPARVVRARIGEGMILGVSVRTPEEALRAEFDGADYLGANNVFGTRTKKDAEIPLGLDAVREITRAVRIPVVGIGGIRPENARSVMEAGARGVAVISAIIAQPSPKDAARRLYEIISR